MQTTLRYGVQKAAEGPLSGEAVNETLADQINRLVSTSSDPHVAEQLRSALRDPDSVIEVRSGDQVQTASPSMPLRELLTPGMGELEITVSKPHVGG